MEVTDWGRYPKVNTDFKSFSSLKDISKIVKNSDSLIARGLGRCYGDSALNSKQIVSTLKFNRILDFNEDTGLINCEAGVSFEDILTVFVSKGWFLPVTPGTKFVTVGGAIASDVHGKNHHIAGSISNHIISMDIMIEDGSVITATKENNSELFWATCGGMGLTGIILKASFKLVKIDSVYIKQDLIKAKNLDEIMDIFENSKDSTFSVAWIDCLSKGDSLGRSLMMRGDFADFNELSEIQKKSALKVPDTKKLNIPFNFPSFTLNSLTVKAFNFLYYNKAPDNKTTSIIDYDKFFYPLDAIHNWNRIYGNNGFTQYQFVLPKEKSKDGLKEILNRIASSGQGSFLAVLKLFGNQDNMINFPKEGYTLALDFKITPTLFKLLDELDILVKKYDGRLYMTKDVRMGRDMLSSGYSNLEEFKSIRIKYNKTKKFNSLQSNRLID